MIGVELVLTCIEAGLAEERRVVETSEDDAALFVAERVIKLYEQALRRIEQEGGDQQGCS